jgi:hypothetical protein
MKKNSLYIITLLMHQFASAQFPPPAGMPGTTAMYKDSSAFVAWATGCTVTLGLQDISNQTLGFANSGDSSMALGQAGTNGTVSLGDGGEAILTFANPVKDGAGWDFAIFENSFSNTFLELAYVEVSSDGVNYFRFPSTSNTQDTLQVGGFGSIDATQIDNLAGKYEALYGTPFDLNQLTGLSGLNTNAVTHIKVIDVVGSIQDMYARFDSHGNKINDPWNTPFPSSGFDLDAVGVIHESPLGLNENTAALDFSVYPNPASEFIYVNLNNIHSSLKISISDLTGKEIRKIELNKQHQNKVDIREIPSGVYFISLGDERNNAVKKIIVQHANAD